MTRDFSQPCPACGCKCLTPEQCHRAQKATKEQPEPDRWLTPCYGCGKTHLLSEECKAATNEQPVGETAVDPITRFSKWIKDNPDANDYAAAVISMHSYFDDADANFGDDPFHDNQAVKGAMELLAMRGLRKLEPSQPVGLSSAELPQVLERWQAASDMIHNLCRRRDDPLAREWMMSIPARPDYDPDLVIHDSLKDIPCLVALLQQRQPERESVAPVGWSVAPDNIDSEPEWRDGFNGEHYTYNTGKHTMFIHELEKDELEALQVFLTSGANIPPLINKTDIEGERK